MSDPVRVVSGSPWRTDDDARQPEWLVANGIGGYATGTLSGLMLRRYHGLLIAALPAPHGRTMMLDLLDERFRLPDGRLVPLGAAQRTAETADADERTEAAAGTHAAAAAANEGHLVEFRLELGLPVWRFEIGAFVIERRLLMPYRRNMVVIGWRLLAGAPEAALQVRPFVNFRPHDARLDSGAAADLRVSAGGDRCEIDVEGSLLPALRLLAHAPNAALHRRAVHRRAIHYATEAERGYDSDGYLRSPGHFDLGLSPGAEAWLIAATEPWREINALRPEDALHAEQRRRRSLIAAADPTLRSGVATELVLAADSFVIAPPPPSPPVTDGHGTAPHQRRARKAGELLPATVIAGYPWFTDWGRDTMISLEGLTLVTGRLREARDILCTFAGRVRDGLIPNVAPERGEASAYNTADATLWFFHALDRYLQASGDRQTLADLLPTLFDIIGHHRRGTLFGIGVDPNDGLLRQGADGYQLTWMDAKIGDWVVTPRRGKAVEINALWYNALCLMQGWAQPSNDEPAAALAALAARAKDAFNRRFWYGEGGYLYDVVDGEHGDDARLRPNQLLAISLPHPVLECARWQPVLQSVETQLRTPVGLRSLAAGDPDYRPAYRGGLRLRDAAYHQGIVWGWLIGPFVDAWCKVHPERSAEAAQLLDGLAAHLDEAGVGSVSEIFDAEPPFAPRGCIAQAWSVAEMLRALRLVRA